MNLARPVMERCSICAATDELLAKIALTKKGEAMREEFRSQLLVAYVFGVKREPLHLCNDCKQRLARVGAVVLGGVG